MIIGCKYHAHSLPVRLGRSKILIFLCILTQSPPSSQISSYRLKRNEVKVAQWCPTLWDPKDYTSPWNSPGQNSGVGSVSLLQGICLTQGLNQSLLHCRWILYQLSYQGGPYRLKTFKCAFLAMTSFLPTQGFFLFFMLMGFWNLKYSTPNSLLYVFMNAYMGLPW